MGGKLIHYSSGKYPLHPPPLLVTSGSLSSQYVLATDSFQLGYSEEGHSKGEVDSSLPAPQRLNWDISSQVMINHLVAILTINNPAGMSVQNISSSLSLSLSRSVRSASVSLFLWPRCWLMMWTSMFSHFEILEREESRGFGSVQMPSFKWPSSWPTTG